MKQQFNVKFGYDDGSEVDPLVITSLRYIKLVAADGGSVFEWDGNKLVLVPPPRSDKPLTDDFDLVLPF